MRNSRAGFMHHRTIAARRGRAVASVWRTTNWRPIDSIERAGLALFVRVEAQLMHDIVESLDAAPDTSLASSPWPSRNLRFSQAVTARNSNKRTQA